MIRTIVLMAVLTLSSAATVEAASVAPVVAQYSSQRDGEEERSSRRSNRGVVKLAIFGVIVAVGIGGWVIKKVRGQ